MPISTTFDVIRASIVTTIAGITPGYTPSSSELWCPAHAQEDVPALDLRSFFVDMGVPVEVGEVFGGCLEHESELRIWTSYGGLTPAEAQVIIARDHHQLWQELIRAEIDGLPFVEKEGFENEAEDGRIWGAHVFSARLFLPLGL